MLLVNNPRLVTMRTLCSAVMIIAAATSPIIVSAARRLPPTAVSDLRGAAGTSANHSVHCGAPLRPLGHSAPNVLVIGDVISGAQGGYLPHLQRLLSPGLATVQHASAGGVALTSSAAAAQCASGWLGGRGWDVVVVALGLGDCVGSGPTPGTSAGFVANLKKIAAAAGGSQVVFASTTPFPFTLTAVNASCVVRNNQALTQAMPAADIADLARAVRSYCGTSYSRCCIQNGLLFNTTDADPSGLQYTALVVAETIERRLPVRKIACTTGARNGSAVPCTWPPPPPPPPAPPAPPGPLLQCAKAATLGCFSETKDHLLFRHSGGAICPKGNVTLECCASACHSMHFPVAGLDGNHCMCGVAAALSPHNSRPMAECQTTNCASSLAITFRI